jgi:hypothetical protein
MNRLHHGSISKAAVTIYQLGDQSGLFDAERSRLVVGLTDGSTASHPKVK